VHTGVWWGNLKERDHLEDPYYPPRSEDNIKLNLQEGVGGAWTGFSGSA